MYKSRVETFNQVYYFHHLIFLFYIIQEDDMENNLQYFIHRPKQKYRTGKGRWNSTLCLWLCWWFLNKWQWLMSLWRMAAHLNASTCFQTDRSLGEKCMQQNNSKTPNRNVATVLLEWNDSYLIRLLTKCLTEKMHYTGMIWTELSSESSLICNKWIW